MIYRHLRQLEQDGLVFSEWETEGTGPAKRMYHITEEGKEVLALWIGYMKKQAETLNAFVNYYGKLRKGSESSAASKSPASGRRPQAGQGSQIRSRKSEKRNKPQ